MECIRCKSKRILSISASFADCCSLSISDNESEGYIKEDISVGRGDMIDFDYCLHCGQIQDQFPKPKLKLENDLTKCDVCGSDALERMEWKNNNYCKTCGAIQEMTIDL